MRSTIASGMRRIFRSERCCQKSVPNASSTEVYQRRVCFRNVLCPHGRGRMCCCRCFQPVHDHVSWIAIDYKKGGLCAKNGAQNLCKSKRYLSFAFALILASILGPWVPKLGPKFVRWLMFWASLCPKWGPKIKQKQKISIFCFYSNVGSQFGPLGTKIGT